MQTKSTAKTVLTLTESAILIALSVVLSLFPLLKMPYGGSVTLAQTLPLTIIAYRHGAKWGFGAAFVFALTQQLFDLHVFEWATSAAAVVLIIVFDYAIAFAVFGLSGIFRKPVSSQRAALALGAGFACVLRFVCHFTSGVVVWSSLTPDGVIYSLGYNATYMLPELLVAVAAAYFIGGVLDFRKQQITYLPMRENAEAKSAFNTAFVFSAFSKIAAAAMMIFDVATIFKGVQDPETGEFLVSGFASAPWPTIGIVSAVGIALAVVFELLSRRLRQHKISV